MLRTAIVVGAPLWVGLSVGSLVGIGAEASLELLDIALAERAKAIPVAVAVVVFGFVGAVESANRLRALLAARDGALHRRARR